MTKLCAGVYPTFSEPQQGLQGSDVVVWGQHNEGALEPTDNNVPDDFLSQPFQPQFENTMQDVPAIFPPQLVLPLNFNQLLGLGKDVTSSNPSIQMTAVHSAMSTISQMDRITSPPSTHQHSHSTASRGFSDMLYYCPPSSQTRLQRASTERGCLPMASTPDPLPLPPPFITVHRPKSHVPTP